MRVAGPTVPFTLPEKTIDMSQFARLPHAPESQPSKISVRKKRRPSILLAVLPILDAAAQVRSY